MADKLRKVRWLLLAVASLTFITGCTNDDLSSLFSDLIETPSEIVDQSAFSELSKHEKIAVNLVRHMDGDTTEFSIDQESVTVRYLLIDTPETIKQGVDPQPFGQEASDRTKQLLSEAQKIEIELDQGESSDKYDRLLAYIFVDDELLQDILIREGLARIAYVKEPSTKYLQQLQGSQEQAKQARLGIWSIEGYATENGFNE